MAKLLYLDPSLGIATGHHLPLARGFAANLNTSDIVFAGAKGGDGAGLKRFAPVFDYRLEDAFRTARYGSALLGKGGVANVVRAMRRLLPNRTALAPIGRAAPLTERAFKSLFTPLNAPRALQSCDAQGAAYTSVLCLAADPALISALHTRREYFERADAPALRIFFLYPEKEFLSSSTAPAYFELLRDMLRWERPPFLYAELRDHARDLQLRLGAGVAWQVLPYRAAATSNAPAGPYTVAVLGAGRRDKAFDTLPEIIAATARRAPDLHFRIQRPMPREGLGASTRALEALSSVTLRPALLSDADYEEELKRAHVILLPYDAERYARRGSGVFVEAVLYGRPIVCLAGTAQAKALRGNGLVSANAADLPDALIAAQRDYSALLGAARREREAAIAAIVDGPLFRALRAE